MYPSLFFRYGLSKPHYSISGLVANSLVNYRMIKEARAALTQEPLQ